MGTIGVSFWWPNPLLASTSCRLGKPGKRRWNLETSSAVNEFLHLLCKYGTEAEIQLLKRFPDSSVSSLIPTGWCGRASHQKNLLKFPWVDNWPMASSGRVKSCKVSPEVWLSTLDQTSDPSLAWKNLSDVFKIKMMMHTSIYCLEKYIYNLKC